MKNKTGRRTIRQPDNFLKAKTLFFVALTALGVIFLTFYSRTAATQEVERIPPLRIDSTAEYLKSTSDHSSLADAFKSLGADDLRNNPEATIKLTANDARPSDWFGSSVAISGDTAIIGAPVAPSGGFANNGAAYVYVRNGSSWVFQQKLTSSDSPANDRDGFGSAVGISENTIVVGAPRRGDSNVDNDYGAAYVFVRTGTNWALQKKLSPADTPLAEGEGVFGMSVAISGETILVGTLGQLQFTDHSSMVHVFVRDGTTWMPQSLLTAINEGDDDSFGESVAISGDTAVIGDTDLGPEAAYIFVRCGNQWTRQQRLLPSDGGNKQFGSSVAISGNSVIVGAYADPIALDNGGSAYVFTTDGETWTQQQKLTVGGDVDDLGISVAISGNTAILGSTGGRLANQAGAAYVLVRTGDSWALAETLLPTGGLPSDGFGRSVAISSDAVIVGSPFDDIGATQTAEGSAYAMDRSTPPGPPVQSPCQEDIEVNITSDEPDADLEDDVCDVNLVQTDLQCSFRAAIQTANAKEGPDEILFVIPGEGTRTISPIGALPPITDKVSIDATTQPGYSTFPLIELKGDLAGVVGGLIFEAGSDTSSVTGLAISRFDNFGINLRSSGNTVTRSFFGLGADGNTSGMPEEQGFGIVISNGGSNNVIGGETVGLGNVISNNASGVAFTGSGSGNTLKNNKIGTDPTGSQGRPNVFGVFSLSSNGNSIGSPTAGNTISGNSETGVALRASSNNVISNNKIGTNSAGSESVANGNYGIFLELGSTGNTIQKNIIGGHTLTETSAGIAIRSDAGPANAINENNIGVGVDGRIALPNVYGVFVLADRQIIGNAGQPNVICHNSLAGIVITGSFDEPVSDSNENVVQNNLIGTDGSLEVGKQPAGIAVFGNATSNILRSNVVAGTGVAIKIADGATVNSIIFNKIGTNMSGTSALVNVVGIQVEKASENLVTDNLVSGNLYGIIIGDLNGTGASTSFNAAPSFQGVVQGSSSTIASGNRLSGNVVGLNFSQTSPIPSGVGIWVSENARSNLIGVENEAQNIVAGNQGFGIVVGTLTSNPSETVVPQSNIIQRNIVGASSNLSGIFANQSGILLAQTVANTIGGETDSLANIILGNDEEGILIDAGSSQNSILRNYIGILPPTMRLSGVETLSNFSASGTLSGNRSNGILVSNGARQNTLGGSTLSSGLVIANNGGNGVNIASTAGNGNRIGANSIFGNSLPGIDLGGNGFTVNDPADADVGPNNLQNYPTLTLSITGGNLIVSYQVDSAPANSAYGSGGIKVDFYEADPTGQGSSLLGTDQYLLDDYNDGLPGTRVKNLGNAAALGVTAGDRITATATDADGNTSEFTPAVVFAATPVTISGRVTTPTGLGLRNAVVTLVEPSGIRRTATTSSFGIYSFANVPSGQNYTISVTSKRYRFAPRIQMISQSVSDLDFVGLE